MSILLQLQHPVYYNELWVIKPVKSDIYIPSKVSGWSVRRLLYTHRLHGEKSIHGILSQVIKVNSDKNQIMYKGFLSSPLHCCPSAGQIVGGHQRDLSKNLKQYKLERKNVDYFLKSLVEIPPMQHPPPPQSRLGTHWIDEMKAKTDCTRVHWECCISQHTEAQTCSTF